MIVVFIRSKDLGEDVREYDISFFLCRVCLLFIYPQNNIYYNSRSTMYATNWGMSYESHGIMNLDTPRDTMDLDKIIFNTPP